MRKSIRSALPTLRPATPGPTRKERRHLVKQVAAENGAEIELNRTIFQDMRPQTTDAGGRPKVAKPKKLQPMNKEKAKTPRRAKSSKQTVEPEKEKEEEPVLDQDLSQIEYLAQRMPPANAELPADIAFKITPILDRVLCTVTDMGQEKCAAYLNHPLIVDLHQRLFALIEVDDFLTRVIVCRILLNFANDTGSPLLLPISQIFFKLSCEPTNDVYFVEESLETVMLTLMTIGEPEVKVMAAGALRNLAASARMRAKLVDSDLFAIGFDVFHDKCDNDKLKLQVVGTFKRMCKEEKFRVKLADSHFLSMAANDKPIYCEVLRVAARVPEMSSEEKCDFLDAFARIEYSSDELIDSTMKCLPVVSQGVEDTKDCATTLNKLIKVIGNSTDDVTLLLDIALKIDQFIDVLKEDEVYIEVAESPDYDSTVKSKVCELLAKFNDPELDDLIREHIKR